MGEYPLNDFPWNFCFNGVTLPKWGACWELVDVCSLEEGQKRWDWDVGPRDICIVFCRMDNTGTVESADPDIFRYVVQEVLCSLLQKRESVFQKLREAHQFSDDADQIYHALIHAAIQMREITVRDGRAFWTRGYDRDRLRLLETIRRASLPLESPGYEAPPHIRSVRAQLESLCRAQIRTLHSIASSSLTKELRTKLLNITH